LRPKAVVFEPRNSPRIPAKRCVAILDTSGSVFCDKELVEHFIRELASICKRVNTTLVVIFADAAVCDVVDIDESFDKIQSLTPKGGGATDFRPAIAMAETLNPDLIVYLTDLCGAFPDKKPRVPIIWGYPPSCENYETPYGQRLPLHP
jgi:predicted metal-dependent peptidase